ncbi:MAG: 3-methyl-2-oxobutanoate dehydrogenase subunit VorB [Erysipelotrichaceae bacterium]
MTRQLRKGNEAIAIAAKHAGCQAYFGYPITPQNEVIEYMMKYQQDDMVVIQAESEVASINMVYGAAASGVKTMTSSASVGIALMQEGISYLSGAKLPAVLVNVMRAGPGLGGILPSQADYTQMVKGGGNGDYKCIVYAPKTVQETYDLVMKAFHVSQTYRMVACIAMDGMLGQMMEAMEETPYPYQDEVVRWAANGETHQRERNVVNSLYLDPVALEQHNLSLQRMYREIEAHETMVEQRGMEDAEIAIVAYGSVARIAESAMEELREKGYRVGLIRPITLWPFPNQEIKALCEHVKFVVNCDLSCGQMMQDLQLALECKKDVHHISRVGGMILEVDEVVQAITALAEEAYGN